jgi:hypothetical protein
MAIDEIVASLPAAREAPVETWSHGDLLNDAAREGLLRIREFIRLHQITAGMSLRNAKQIVDAAIPVAKHLSHGLARLQQREEPRLVRLEASAAQRQSAKGPRRDRGRDVHY